MTELEGGDILIDDVPITSLPRSTVRQRVLAVPQEPLLLSGTVRFNVDPFSQHQDDKIIAMLGDIGLLDIVQSVDGGLDAHMDSLSLSRGQQQLFCLGRALLCDSRVVVLDEITSSVDDVTEEKMMALVSSRFTNRTVLAIAHHIRTLRDFDMIVVLDHGRVVETGSPDELLSRDSVFRELWDRQN
jgi:ATP-binding cassette, subfamily C (CFTR/MRP), member 1